MTACSTCGAANAADARFCSNCGSALPASSPADEVRKTVTILFCDVTGSTQLGEQLDPESLRKVMARFFDAMRAEIELHGGTVEKFIGDAVMAVFGIPTLHEDDALRAVRAADGMREALEPLNKDLERDFGVRLTTRIGVNTGEVLVGPATTDFGRMTGDAVNTAARLETAAQPGEVLIGADTYRLVRDAVDVESVEPQTVKGKAEPVECYRLVGVLAGTAAPPRAFTSPIVGRERELEDLERAFERSVQDRTCLLFTVLGAAGAGKSRLVEEFLGGVGGSAQVLVGRCLPYGEGITYWPVAQALRAAMELHDFDEPEEVRSRLDGILAGDDHADAIAARLSEVLGIAEGHSAPEETAWAIRRFLEILASERPVIAVWEDVHWAEPALLDAIDHVADWAGDAPILLLCTARPEFLDSRPGWGAGKQRASALTLPPLDADASTELIANLLGGGRLPADAADRVADAGGGNPLFVEQMVSMLIDDGLVVRDDGGREDAGWTPVGDLSSIAVPPSVAALLAARLERLSDDERRAIGSAAVIGKIFYLGAARELLPEPDRANAGPLVRSLVRKELVRETRSTIPGEDAFEFRHILIRDAAYAAIPKERRAEQHRRFADWCVRVAGERIEELEEIVGYHLEQAFRNRESIGALDEEARALAIEASARLESAGMRAFDRPDVSAATNLLRRAETLLPQDDPRRVVVMTTLAYALFDMGRLDEARNTVAEAEALAASAGDPVAVERATIARWSLVDPGVERHEADEDGREKGDRGVRGRRRAARARPGVEPPLEHRVAAGPGRGAARRGGARIGTRPGRDRSLRGARCSREPHVRLSSGDRRPSRKASPAPSGRSRDTRGAERWTRSCAMGSRTSEPGSASSTLRAWRWTGTGPSIAIPARRCPTFAPSRSPSTSRCSPARRSTPATSSRKPRGRSRSSATPGRTSRRSWGRVGTP